MKKDEKELLKVTECPEMHEYKLLEAVDKRFYAKDLKKKIGKEVWFHSTMRGIWMNKFYLARKINSLAVMNYAFKSMKQQNDKYIRQGNLLKNGTLTNKWLEAVQINFEKYNYTDPKNTLTRFNEYVRYNKA